MRNVSIPVNNWKHDFGEKSARGYSYYDVRAPWHDPIQPFFQKEMRKGHVPAKCHRDPPNSSAAISEKKLMGVGHHVSLHRRGVLTIYASACSLPQKRFTGRLPERNISISVWRKCCAPGVRLCAKICLCTLHVNIPFPDTVHECILTVLVKYSNAILSKYALNMSAYRATNTAAEATKKSPEDSRVLYRTTKSVWWAGHEAEVAFSSITRISPSNKSLSEFGASMQHLNARAFSMTSARSRSHTIDMDRKRAFMFIQTEAERWSAKPESNNR